MSKLLTMPRLGETMEQGTLRSWLVKPGVAFKRGDVIAEIETDKTVVELPALEDGVVETFIAGEGDVIAVDGALAELEGEPSSGPSGHLLPRGEKGSAARLAPSPISGEGGRRPDEGPRQSARTPASTAARKLARKNGFDLASIPATGRNGRVQGWDVKAALTSHSTVSAAAALHFSIRGEGTAMPLVLLHGFGGDKDGWLNLAVPFAQHRKVISLDLPGHGGSFAHPAVGFEAMAAAVLATLDQIGMERAHLVGHSMGGGVALALAVAKPSQVASLTLFAPAGIGIDINARLLTAYAAATSEAEVALIIDQFFGADAKIPRGLAASIAVARKAPGVIDGLRRAAAGMLDGVQQRVLPMDRIAALDMPIRVIWGEDDRLLPMTHARRLPGVVAVHRYRRVGHMPQIEIGRDAVRIVQMNIAGD